MPKILLKKDKESSDCWTQFTKWSYSSFSQYLIIDEKAKICLHSWVPGDASYYFLLIWRIMGAFSHAFFWIIKTYDDNKKEGFGYGFRYLTNWGVFLTMVCFILFLLQYIVEFCRRGNAQIVALKTGKKETTVCKADFLWQLNNWLFSLVLCLNIAITSIYWLFLGKGTLDYISYVNHILPIVFTGVDFIFNLVLVELNLVIWNILFIAIYLIINYIYVTLILFQPIYEVLTWSTPAIIARDFFMYLAVAPVLHVLLWLLSWLKLWLIYGEKRRD